MSSLSSAIRPATAGRVAVAATVVPALVALAWCVQHGWTIALAGPGGLWLAATARVLSQTSARIAASAAGYACLAASACVLVALGIAPRVLGYRTLTVLSGSMRPTFDPGDLIVVRPVPLRDLKVGDVITYAIPVGDRHVETHRIVRVLHGGETPTVVTKGDANTAPDPWQATLHGTTGWRLSRRIRFAGYGIVALRTPAVRLVLVFLVPAVLALLALTSIWRIRVPFRDAAA